MAIIQSVIKRVFKYNGITLSDPSVEKTPDQVRVLFAPMYPELLNAVVEGPVTKAGTSTYTFARAAGSKGAGHMAALSKILIHGMPNTGSPFDGATTTSLQENKKCSQTAASVLNSRTISTPVLPMAAAFSRFG
jgi:PRTRC genetic system protein C